MKRIGFGAWLLWGLSLCLGLFLFATPASAQVGATAGNNNPGNSGNSTVVESGAEIPFRRPDHVLAPSGQPEVMALAPTGEVQAAIAALTAEGAQFLRQRNYPALGRTGLFFTFGPGQTLQSARRALGPTAPNTVISLHALYRFAQGSPRIYAHEMVGLVSAEGCTYGGGTVIGVIDGPVNPGHQALAGVSVTSESVLSAGDRPISAEHGTAVAALIAGRGGALTGMASGARLYAISAFARTGSGVAASTERVLAALDRLTGQGVRLINMSFAGPPSDVMEIALSVAAGRGVTMIAAAGNDGVRFAPYPAGSQYVIAVTAIDDRMRLYRDANTGGHIEFAAPGVDVFVASGGGGTYQSGTSYAAPIVTALAARLGGGSVNAVRSRLQSVSVDLGSPGRDGQFGWGLVRASGC